MPTSAQNLFASSLARVWKSETGQSSRASETPPILLKPQVKATVEEISDDFYDAQRAGEQFLQKSRQAASGFSLRETQQALKQFGRASKMAPDHAAPHAGMFPAWRAVHADALGARPIWAKKHVRATCEQSGAAMLQELSWLLNHSPKDTLHAAMRFPGDLFIELGAEEGPLLLREHLLPALTTRFGGSASTDDDLLLSGIALLENLLEHQPWAITHALLVLDKMMRQQNLPEQAGQALSRMIVSLAEQRRASSVEWTTLARALAGRFGSYTAVMMPLMPFVRRGLRESRGNAPVYDLYVGLLVEMGRLGEDKTQLFEAVRLLGDEVLALIDLKEGMLTQPSQKRTQEIADAEPLIDGLYGICAHAQDVFGPYDRIVSQLGAERLNEISKKSICPKAAMAAFSARAKLGFGARPL